MPWDDVDSEGSDDDACEVFWQTKSILDLDANPALRQPPSPPPLSSNGLALAGTSIGPSRKSSTPLKPKRGTTSASLPSPSASSTASGKPQRILKRRKSTGIPKPSSQQVDSGTLRLVNQLAMRFNDRALRSQQQRSTPGPVLREKSANLPLNGPSPARALDKAKSSDKGSESIERIL